MSSLLNSVKRNRTLYNLYAPLKNYYRKIKEAKADSYEGLNGRISQRDTMFNGDIAHYIKVGKSAIENIERGLTAANKSFASLHNVLDMPSGHGRVLRFLAEKVSPEKITACDLDEDGIDFCAKELKCKKFLSTRDLSKLHLPDKYSLIWVGSLFTHLNKAAFSDLLRLLFNALEPGGILVFTSHGDYSVEIFESYWRAQPKVPVSAEQLQEELMKTNGFYYAPYAQTEDYGISISLPGYVTALVESLFADQATILFHKARGWDNHQDVFAMQRKN